MKQKFSDFNIGDIVTLESNIFSLTYNHKRHKIVSIDDTHFKLEYDRNYYDKGKESFGGHFVFIDKMFLGDVRMVKIKK
jgi:hypothetical protein